MNFSESLDKFILNGADRRSKMQNSSGCEHMDKAISRLLKIGYEDCAASLKPIVLKLYEALNKIERHSDQSIVCLMAMNAIIEIEQMLEGGGAIPASHKTWCQDKRCDGNCREE